MACWIRWSMFCGLTSQIQTFFWLALSLEGYFGQRMPATRGLRFRRMPRSVQLPRWRGVSWQGPASALSFRATTGVPGRCFRVRPAVNGSDIIAGLDQGGLLWKGPSDQTWRTVVAPNSQFTYGMSQSIRWMQRWPTISAAMAAPPTTRSFDPWIGALPGRSSTHQRPRTGDIRRRWL